LNKSRRGIKHGPGRVVLSDTLPFELPIGFDNTAWYSFLNRAQFEWDADGYKFRADKDGLNELVLRIVFNRVAEVNVASAERLEVRFFKRPSPTVPFQFEINTRNGRGRVLSVPHPAIQLRIARFYDKYRALILHHSRRSHFSLRAPSRIARYTTVRDSLFAADRDRSSRESVEVRDRESHALHSYFVYREVASLHRFYESRSYLEAEKHYSALTRLDLSRCFDSIYTHSIAWALHEREVVKRDIASHKSTFAGEFDALMQLMNDNETNGILIGPEVSRIFAEMILQGADRSLERVLRARGVVPGRDYQVLRYVDDYFIFHNDPAIERVIVSELENELRPYKMNLNSAKEERLIAPYVSPMSSAKRALNRAITKQLPLLASDLNVVTGEHVIKNLLHEFKTVVLQSGLSAGDLANYSMAVVESRLEEVLRVAAKGADAELSALSSATIVHLLPLLSGSIEFLFYVYGSNPLVSGGVKVARTVAMVRRFMSEWTFPYSSRLLVDELIGRECSRLLRRMKLEGGVESVYLLDILAELPQDHDLSEAEFGHVTGGFPFSSDRGELAMLEVFAVLRYAGPRAHLQPFVRASEVWLRSRADALQELLRPSSELVILVLDAIASPWVDDAVKGYLLRLFVPKASNARAVELGALQEGWFGRWRWDDLYAELRLKRVHEVY
jgi:hypothetical protein